MGKIIRTITMDNEVWLSARKKTDNLSGTINDLLEQWVRVTKDKEMNDREKSKIELEELRLQLAAKEQEIQRMKDNQPKILREIS